MTVYPAWVEPKHHLKTLELVAQGMEKHISKIQDQSLKQKWLKELRLNYSSQDRIKDYINTHRFQDVRYADV